MIRRPPRSTQSRSSAASDVYKRQVPRLLQAGRHEYGAETATLIALDYRQRAHFCQVGPVDVQGAAGNHDTVLAVHHPEIPQILVQLAKRPAKHHSRLGVLVDQPVHNRHVANASLAARHGGWTGSLY